MILKASSNFFNLKILKDFRMCEPKPKLIILCRVLPRKHACNGVNLIILFLKITCNISPNFLHRKNAPNLCILRHI